MSKVTIYTLGEPIMGTVKYVDYTDDLDGTLEKLYNLAETEPETPLLRWVEDLLDGGWKPAVKKVKTVDSKVAVAETKRVYKEYASKSPRVYTGHLNLKPKKGWTKESRKRHSKRFSIPVYQYRLDGVFVAKHASTSIASRDTNVSLANISNQIAGNVRQAGGFFWSRHKLTDEEKKAYIKPLSPKYKAVNQYDLNGNYINSFNSIKAACESTGFPSSNVVSVLKGRVKQIGGFVWKYA